MDWAEVYSRNYAKLCFPKGNFIRIIGHIRGFVLLKNRLLSMLRAEGVKIPTRAARGRTMLETLLLKVPEGRKQDVKNLIRVRETCIPYVLPVVRNAALIFLSRRLGMRFGDVARFVRSTQFEAVLALAVRQGLDRTKKVGIRLDFVLAAVARLVSDIQTERQMLRITLENDDDSTTIHEAMLVDPDSEFSQW